MFIRKYASYRRKLSGRLVFICTLLTAFAGNAFADSFSTLYTWPNGAGPSGGLVQADDGNLYGAAFGVAGATFGGIFQLTPSGTYSTIYSFNSQSQQNPFVSFQGADGTLYGGTLTGGETGAGYLFRVTTAGTLTTIYTFSGAADGGGPISLIQGTDGNLYGLTYQGGTMSACGNVGCGTIFRVTTSGSLTTLYSFSGGADGSLQNGGSLVEGSDGNLYGTTVTGGTTAECGFYSPGCGTVFKITLSGTFTSLHVFSGGTGTDGSNPGVIIQGADGSLYGITNAGGSGSAGTVYSMTFSGVLSTLYSFNNAQGEGFPIGLLQGSDGNLYGTTYDADEPDGVVFELTPSGTLTTLDVFFNTGGSSMIQASDGTLYGVAAIAYPTEDNHGLVFQESLTASSPSGGSSSSSGSGGSSGSGSGGAMPFSVLCVLCLGVAVRRRGWRIDRS